MSAVNARIEAELALLRQHFEHVEHVLENRMHWFSVQSLKMPEGWTPSRVAVVFSITEGYPGAEPYGFLVPVELSLHGQRLAASGAPHQPPFVGSWVFLSWAPEGWRATAEIHAGSNLLAWVRTFPFRMEEGV